MSLDESDVAAVDDLAGGRKGFGCACQIEQPGPAERLVETNRVDRMYPLPVRLEILQPLLHGAVVMTGAIIDRSHVQAIFLHQDQRLGETGNVAAGKDMLDRAVVGRALFHVEGRRYQADSAGTQADGDAPDPLLVAVPAGVLVDADRDEPVVAGRLVCQLAMILFHQRDLAVEVAGLHEHAHAVVLARDEPVTGHIGAILFRGEHRQVSPAGTDFDQSVAATELKLPADQVEVVVLRLVEGGRVYFPESLRLGIGVTQHEMKELCRHAVVEGGVTLGLGQVFIVLLPLEEMSFDEGQRVLETAEGFAKSDMDQLAQAMLTDDIDVAAEVRLEEFEHPAECHAPFRGAFAENDRDVRVAEACAVIGAVVGKNDLQMIFLALGNAVDDAPDQRSDHGKSVRSEFGASTAVHACMHPPKCNQLYFIDVP